MKKLHVIGVLLLCFAELIRTEIFTSTIRLEELFRKEVGLTASMRRYVNENPRYLTSKIQTLLVNAEDAIKVSLRSPEYLHHPISIYHAIKRSMFDWKEVQNCLSDGDSNSTSRSDLQYIDVAERYNDMVISGDTVPTELDLNGAIESIIRLWYTYRLDINKLICGEINGIKVQRLSKLDLESFIRLAATKGKYFYQEIILANKLHDILTKDTNEKQRARAGLQLSQVYRKHGFMDHALAALIPHILKGNDEVDKSYKRFLSNTAGYDDGRTAFLVPEAHSSDYEPLCRGEIKSATGFSRLKCYFKKTRIPYWMAKEEVVNVNPRISLFHEVIYEHEINQLKNFAKPLIRRSEVVSTNEDTEEEYDYADYRLSHTALLDSPEHPLTDKLDRRVELITGLDTKDNAEMLQVTNYGIGGMYEPHHDHFEDDDFTGVGNRIATWMYYLSDVQAGGATVFPEIRTRIPVIKGAAAFWYNLMSNGDGDHRTLHAGCPVLIGSKIILNRWIAHVGQVFRKPCSLNHGDINK